MAGTATLYAFLQIVNSQLATAQIQFPSTQISTASDQFEQSVMLVPSTAGGTAIPLAATAAGGLFIMVNNDPTNTVYILNAVSGTKLLELLPGDVAMGRFANTVSAPAAQSSAGTPELSYLICAA